MYTGTLKREMSLPIQSFMSAQTFRLRLASTCSGRLLLRSGAIPRLLCSQLVFQWE